MNLPWEEGGIMQEEKYYASIDSGGFKLFSITVDRNGRVGNLFSLNFNCFKCYIFIEKARHVFKNWFNAFKLINENLHKI